MAAVAYYARTQLGVKMFIAMAPAGKDINNL